MEGRMERRNAKRLVWGLFLIAIGVGFMLQRYGLVDIPRIWDLWPAVFWVIAIGRVIEGRVGSAVTFVLMGFWFFACTFRWQGLDYDNSWPLLLVAVGAGIIIRALTGEDEKWKLRMKENGEELMGALRRKEEKWKQRWEEERHED